MYLINFGTQNFFSRTIFKIIHIFAAYMGHSNLPLSIALLLDSSVISSSSISSDDFILWDLFVNVSETVGVDVSVIDSINVGLCWDPELVLLLFLWVKLPLDFEQK